MSESTFDPVAAGFALTFFVFWIVFTTLLLDLLWRIEARCRLELSQRWGAGCFLLAAPLAAAAVYQVWALTGWLP